MNKLTIFIAIGSLIGVSLLWQHNFILLLVISILAIILLLNKKSKRELKLFIFL